jgi:IS5 family transposase
MQLFFCKYFFHDNLENLGNSRLQEGITGLDFTDYRKEAKRTSFKINVTKDADKRVKLFQKQLKLFTECINQVSNIVKKKSAYKGNICAVIWIKEMKELLPEMKKVYQMTYRREILGEAVPVSEKILTIIKTIVKILNNWRLI